jgi:hypothetical protein
MTNQEHWAQFKEIHSPLTVRLCEEFISNAISEQDFIAAYCDRARHSPSDARATLKFLKKYCIPLAR